MSAPSGRRTQAPFGRRAVTVLASRQLGAYSVLDCADTAAQPRPGQFYMLSSEQRWGAVCDGRPFLPRALSFLRHDRGADRLQFLLEDVGPGTRRLCELASGDLVWLLGPLGQGFASPPDGRAAIVIGGGIGIAPLAGLVDELRAKGNETTVLLGFRDGAHAEAAELIAGARVSSDDGSVGEHGLVTDPLAREPRARSQPRRLRMRPPGDAGTRAGAVRRHRRRRAARTRGTNGMRVRSMLRLCGADKNGLSARLPRRTSLRRSNDRATRNNGRDQRPG